MKNILFILIILLSIIGCSKSVDDDLQPYVDDFERLCQEYGRCDDGVDIPVYFTKRLEPLGRCIKSFDRGKRVAIDEIAWQDLSWCQRESVVFHELGHCVLGYKHSDIEDSYMWFELNDLDCDLHQKLRDEKIEHLFT